MASLLPVGEQARYSFGVIVAKEGVDDRLCAESEASCQNGLLSLVFRASTQLSQDGLQVIASDPLPANQKGWWVSKWVGESRDRVEDSDLSPLGKVKRALINLYLPPSADLLQADLENSFEARLVVGIAELIRDRCLAQIMPKESGYNIHIGRNSYRADSLLDHSTSLKMVNITPKFRFVQLPEESQEEAKTGAPVEGLQNGDFPLDASCYFGVAIQDEVSNHFYAEANGQFQDGTASLVFRTFDKPSRVAESALRQKPFLDNGSLQTRTWVILKRGERQVALRDELRQVTRVLINLHPTKADSSGEVLIGNFTLAIAALVKKSFTKLNQRESSFTVQMPGLPLSSDDYLVGSGRTEDGKLRLYNKLFKD